jgi:hypothetical protein
MSITDRMQALGDHAKLSRQPPLRPRKLSSSDGSTAMPTVVQSIPKSSVAGEAPQAIFAETIDTSTTTQAAIHDNGNDTVARRAIVHEWEHWSALHPDELDDANVGKYFFSFLQRKKPHLLTYSDDEWETVRGWLVGEGRVKN